jgi:hypothetical protein
VRGERTYRQPFFARAALALIVFLLAWPALAVHADGEGSGISLQSTIGYQGSYKDGRWYPARLILTNDTEDTLKGDLVLSYINGDNVTTNSVVPLELPPGSPVQVTVGVPGVILNKDSNRIAFYEGGYNDKGTGKQLGERGYLDSRNSLSYMIGVVSRDPDTFNFMPQLNQKGYDIAVYPLKPEDLPDETELLDSLDVIVINDIPTGDWSESRVQAIRDWVIRGGTLVLSGGAGYEQTSRAFAELAPVVAGGTSQLTSALALESAGGESLALPNGLTVSNGKAVRGTAIVVEGEVPLAVSAEQGFGQIVYAAFDPSLEPMASWAGSSLLWAKLLSDTLMPTSVNAAMGSGGYLNQYWQLNNILDLFPSIKQPELLLLIAMLGIYILVIAPMLYIVLAKADRREWAWWLIPVLSIVMGVTVFFIGSGDKRSVMSHTVEIVEISGDGHAVISGGTGIFTPAGGTVTALFDEAKPIRFYGDNGMRNGLNSNGHYQLWSGNAETKAVWKGVPYWSTRKLWTDRQAAAAEETGTLDVSYKDDNGTSKAIVTNNTTVDLTDVYLLAQGSSTLIGDLKKGESGEAAMPSMPAQGYFYYGGSVFPHPTNNRQVDEHRRQRELLDMYFNRFNNGVLQAQQPVIVGFSEDHASQYLVDGAKVQSDNLRMWIKELEPVIQTGGRVHVPAGAISPIMTSNTIQSYSSYGDGTMQISAGEMEMEYLLPNGYGVAYDKLDINFVNGNSNPNAVWSIWQESTGQWVELGGSLEAPAAYLTPAQSIRLKMVSTSEGMIWMPQLTLEGEVLQP